MKKAVCIVLLILAMGSMYYFSSQEGYTSSQQSQKVVELIDKVRDKVTLTDERLISIKDKIYNELRGYNKEYIVRKAAHFSIYACIGGSMLLVVYLFTKKVIFSSIFSFILTVMYAIYDEKRQLEVSGRVSSITDVFIDSSGALLAIIFLAILLATGKGIENIISLFKRSNI